MVDILLELTFIKLNNWFATTYQEYRVIAYLKENKSFHNSFEQRPLEPPPMFNSIPIGGRMDGPNSNMPPRGPHGVNIPRWGRPSDRERDEFLAKRRRF